MTESDAYALLRRWADEQGMDAASLGGAGWVATAVRDLWIVTPPGRNNTLYVVAADEVRVVHPGRESLADVLASMGRSQ